ncbi:redoxin domain-containing protein [Pseudothermotoga sp. U03pept]|uniref:redoxin domain-containing protein n=1 Tax=Pseudothermotoga sp. U03pept TaxID=3447012 RepID=UPI003F05FF31
MKLVDFKLLDEENRERTNLDLLGRYTVLYFFPKAGTLSCTQEAQDFSKEIEWFESRGAQVFGVSRDSSKTLKIFKEKYQLRMSFLADTNGELAKSLNAQKNGKILRSTLILDRWYRIRWSAFNVKVAGHVEQVKAELLKIISEDNSLNQLIVLRRARRALSEEKISDEQLRILLQAAHLAPSCSNKQPWRFIVVRSKEMLEKVHEALSGGNYWMKKAPALIIVHSKKDMDCQLSDNRDYFLFDLGQAVAFLQIQATQMGLVAHPVAGFDPIAVKKIFPNLEDHVLITILAIAYPTGDLSGLSEKHQNAELSARDRQPLENVLEFV